MTRDVRWEQLDEDLAYEASQLDHDAHIFGSETSQIVTESVG